MYSQQLSDWPFKIIQVLTQDMQNKQTWFIMGISSFTAPSSCQNKAIKVTGSQSHSNEFSSQWYIDLTFLLFMPFDSSILKSLSGFWICWRATQMLKNTIRLTSACTPKSLYAKRLVSTPFQLLKHQSFIVKWKARVIRVKWGFILDDLLGENWSSILKRNMI